MDREELYADYLHHLTILTAMQSVSPGGAPEHKEWMLRCALVYVDIFKESGFSIRIDPDSYGNPVLCAFFDAGTENTILIYGHYDVQPADEDGWVNSPWELTSRDGKLYGRGTTDNKGQTLIHIATIRALIRARKLAYNVIFLLEGDEETGSGKIGAYIRDHRDLLSAHCVVISDGEGTNAHPVIETSFRGVFSGSFTITTAKTNCHSGLFGGIMVNAAAELIPLLDRVLNNRPYDFEYPHDGPLGYKLTQPTKKRLAELMTFDAEGFARDIGGIFDHSETLPTETILGFVPSIEITGLSSGYAGPGYKNMIPATATCKFNVRLGPTQPAHLCRQKFETYLVNKLNEWQSWRGSNASFTTNFSTAADGVLLDTDNPYMKRMQVCVKDVCGFKAPYRACGAAIPIVTDIARELHIPQILLSLGNPDCNMHAANENISRAAVERGFAISYNFFSNDFCS